MGKRMLINQALSKFGAASLPLVGFPWIVGFHNCCRRILGVTFPLRWILHDILSDTIQRFLSTNDVFVIVALP